MNNINLCLGDIMLIYFDFPPPTGEVKFGDVQRFLAGLADSFPKGSDYSSATRGLCSKP